MVNWLRIKLACTFFLAFAAVVGVLMLLEHLIGGKPLAIGLAVGMVALFCWFIAGEVCEDRRYKDKPWESEQGTQWHAEGRKVGGFPPKKKTTKTQGFSGA